MGDEWLFTNKDMRYYFEEDPSLDQLAQATELFAFMLTPIRDLRDSTLKTHLFDIDTFRYLLTTSFPDKGDLFANVVSTTLLNYTSNSLKKKIKRAGKGIQENGQLTDLCCISAYAVDMLSPRGASLIPTLPQKFSSTIESNQVTDITIKPGHELGGKLLLLIKERNEKYLRIARMTSMMLPPTEEQEKSLGNLYAKKNEPHEAFFARYFFSTLACHIGHFAKPQFGKWEVFYTALTNRDYHTIIPRTTEEINRDLITQLAAENSTNLHTMTRIQTIHQELTAKEQQVIDLEYRLKTENKSKIKKEKQLTRVNDDLDKKIADVNALRNSYDTFKTSELKRLKDEYNTKLKEYGVKIKSISKLEHERDKYLKKNEDLQQDVQDLDAYIAKLEMRLESKASESVEQAPVKVEFHPSLSSRLEDPTYKSVIEDATDKLAHGKGFRRRLNRAKYGGYTFLKSQFPKHSDFYKLHCGLRFRVAYEPQADGSIMVLRIDDHPEYESTWGNG